MPNLQSMGLSTASRAFVLVGSDGRTLILTKAQVQAFYQTTTGNATARRTAVLTWIRGQITSVLGAEMVDASLVDLDFSVVDGGLSRLDVSGR